MQDAPPPQAQTTPSVTPPFAQRNWWQGFGARIMLAVALLALSIILVTSIFSYNALREKSIDVASLALRGQANTLRNDLESRITHMAEGLHELSTNPLFANALADDLGREVYLRDFIGGLALTEGFSVTITMTDFRGRSIRSNQVASTLVMEPSWVAQSINANQRTGIIVIRDNAPILVLVEPLIFLNTGTAEGALVYQVDLSQWLASQFVNRIFSQSNWLSSLSLVNDINRGIVDGTFARSGSQTSDDPEILQRIQVPGHITGEPLSVRLTAAASFVEEPLKQLLVNVSIMSTLVFVLALMGSFGLSRTLTKKLSRLQSEAAHVSEAKFRDIEFTDEGRDEIDDLARAFSDLIDQLQDAYRQLEDDSRREIEVRERHYKDIVNNSAEGIITISQTGTIETFNPSAERIFGYRAFEVIDQNVSMLMPPQDRTDHDKYLAHSTLHAPRIINRSRELTGLRKDGSTFPLELNVSPMDLDGANKYIGIMRDISERKEFEERITVARVEAEQANKAKSQFLSSMSHELRTPLNAILGFGQLLQMGGSRSLSKPQNEAVQQILKGGKHLLELIDQVLNLAKIESGNVAISIEPIDVAGLLDDSLAMAKTMAKERFIEVHSDFPFCEVPVFINADRTRTQQVLLNLLSNAIKYNAPKGTVTLSFSVDEKRGVCRFRVTDTGPGIAEDMHDQVFLPFNRLGAESSEIEGTGIGLTITRELVHMMGGKIDFTSVLSPNSGHGTTFWFELPLTPASQQPDAADANSHTSIAPPRNGDENARVILYIEDNPSNLQLMEMLFSQRADWQLITSHTAESGLAIAKVSPPDLVLMDINLPGMSGIEALRELRKDDSTCEVPVIAISANAMAREIEEAMKEGFFEYLTKPLDLNNAIKVIEKALAQAPGAQA